MSKSPIPPELKRLLWLGNFLLVYVFGSLAWTTYSIGKFLWGLL